jgi:tetratricopeptide (TPR) repeat protein
MITVDMADIHNRLALCYFETREWNKGISAFSEALNLYKKNKLTAEYANCITNLGVLYIEVGYFIEAEKCLLIAYNIKRY